MNISIPETFGYSVLGMAVVFLMLILLMVIIIAMGKSAKNKAAAKKAPVQAQAPVQQAPAAQALAVSKPAPGTCGTLNLRAVEPRTAALIMAIVADEMGVPLNELRFISIKKI